MPERVFVVGVGMADFVKPSARPDGDYPEMAREAGNRPLALAGLAYDPIEPVALQHDLGPGGAAVRTLDRRDPD